MNDLGAGAQEGPLGSDPVGCIRDLGAPADQGRQDLDHLRPYS